MFVIYIGLKGEGLYLESWEKWRMQGKVAVCLMSQYCVVYFCHFIDSLEMHQTSSFFLILNWIRPCVNPNRDTQPLGEVGKRKPVFRYIFVYMFHL